MAVYRVVITAPNGNSRSRPIVHDSAEHAMDQYLAESRLPELEQARRQGFQVAATLQEDPDGEYERLLVDAERRAAENEYFRR